MWTQPIFKVADSVSVSQILKPLTNEGVFSSASHQLGFYYHTQINVDVKMPVQGFESNSTGGRAWLRGGLQIHSRGFESPSVVQKYSLEVSQ